LVPDEEGRSIYGDRGATATLASNAVDAGR